LGDTKKNYEVKAKMEGLDIILVLLGIALALAGLGVIKKFKLKNYKIAAILVGIILVGIGWFGSANIADQFSVSTGQISTTPVITDNIAATFLITPGATTNCVLNAEKSGFMVAATANTTAHTLKRSDNSTSWAAPVVTFGIVPIPPSGTFDSTTGCTIYYSVSPADISVDISSGGNYKMFTLSGGNRQLIWADGSALTYVTGSKSILLTNASTSFTLTFTVNQDSMSRIENTYSPLSVYVTFSNGAGWSQVYKVDFMLLNSYA